MSSERIEAIAIDVMGSDLGPAEVIAGVGLALQRYGGLCPLILVGDEAQIIPLLKQHNLISHPKISILHASEVIGMDEKPLTSIKQKKDSSMLRAIDMVREGKAQAALSCGNTGSLMAGSTIKLRPIEGIERPALATIAPSSTHNFVILDVGANPKPTPLQLVHNAVLGYHYARIALNKKEPRVGLLTTGTEEWKGNELVAETHQKLKAVQSNVNYVGLIEGFQIFNNHVDVIVCDGFVGNILLKTCESLFKHFKLYLKKELQQNWLRQLGGLLALGAFKNMKKHFDPEQFGGAPLLGLNGTVIKAHGSSTRNAIMHAIRMSHDLIKNHFYEDLLSNLEKVNQRISISEL